MAQLMNTKTEIRTEYAGMGLKPDGTWRVITLRQNTAEKAAQLLEEHISEIRRFPDLFTSYADYKVMHRRVITTSEAWSDNAE